MDGTTKDEGAAGSLAIDGEGLLWQKNADIEEDAKLLVSLAEHVK